MMQTPVCQKICQEIEQVAAHIEQFADDTDLNAVLSKLPKDTLPS